MTGFTDRTIHNITGRKKIISVSFFMCLVPVIHRIGRADRNTGATHPLLSGYFWRNKNAGCSIIMVKIPWCFCICRGFRIVADTGCTKIIVVGIGIKIETDTPLFQITDTSRLFPGFFHFPQRREQHGGKDGDDRNTTRSSIKVKLNSFTCPWAGFFVTSAQLQQR